MRSEDLQPEPVGPLALRRRFGFGGVRGQLEAGLHEIGHVHAAPDGPGDLALFVDGHLGRYPGPTAPCRRARRRGARPGRGGGCAWPRRRWPASGPVLGVDALLVGVVGPRERPGVEAVERLQAGCPRRPRRWRGPTPTCRGPNASRASCRRSVRSGSFSSGAGGRRGSDRPPCLDAAAVGTPSEGSPARRRRASGGVGGRQLLGEDRSGEAGGRGHVEGIDEGRGDLQAPPPGGVFAPAARRAAGRSRRRPARRRC